VAESPVTTDRILPAIATGSRSQPADGVAAAAGGAHEVVAPPRSTPGWAVPEPEVASRGTATTAKAARLAKPRGEAWLSTATRAGMLVGVSAAVYAVSLASVSGLQAQSQAEVAAANQPAVDAVARAKAANDALDAAIQDANRRLEALARQYDSVSSDMSAYQAQFDRLSQLVAKIQGSAATLNAGFTLPAVTMHGAIGGGGGGGTVVVTTTSASGKP
jgi:prefoldin subunit 5